MFKKFLALIFYIIIDLSHTHGISIKNDDQSLTDANETISLHWIDSSGQSIPIYWPTQIKWQWKETHRGSIPFFKVQIEIPPHVRSLFIKSPNQSSIGNVLNAPSIQKQDGKRLLIVETQSPKFIANISLSMEDSKVKIEEAGILGNIDVHDTKVIIHPNCLTANIKIVAKPASKDIFFLAAYCSVNEVPYTLTLYTSHDAGFVTNESEEFKQNIYSTILNENIFKETKLLGAILKNRNTDESYKITAWQGSTIFNANVENKEVKSKNTSIAIYPSWFKYTEPNFNTYLMQAELKTKLLGEMTSSTLTIEAEMTIFSIASSGSLNFLGSSRADQFGFYFLLPTLALTSNKKRVLNFKVGGSTLLWKPEGSLNVSKIRMGPKVSALLVTNNCFKNINRNCELELSLTPFLSGYVIGTLGSYPLNFSIFNQSELVFKLNSWKFLDSGPTDVDAVQFSFGIRTWY